ncbi:MAG TPA: 2'-deoxycytidine 5'-triphosphate deaminase [Beijerinckiaceae bacterium]|jgi:dCTP deaminase
MTNTGETMGLFPFEAGPSDNGGSSNVVEARGTGVLPYQRLVTMAQRGVIKAHPEIELDQFQPASLDLRLGRYAYRVRASFLPHNSTVMERVKELDGLPAIDLTHGAILERGFVYVVELQEAVSLPSDYVGIANPKSSTGRLDILTRLITDRGTAFDRIDPRYSGPLFLEVAPLSFSVVAYTGVRLTQIRLHRLRGAEPGLLPQHRIEKLYRDGQLVGTRDELLPLRDGVLVPVTVDLEGDGPNAIVGYKARKDADKIDLARVGHYNPEDYWRKIPRTNGRLHLDAKEFYILATREDVGVPPTTAAEMVPYDTRSGEFRVHYAGFFDPGFGWADDKAQGSKAVLEVRSYGVSFTLEHGQIIGWMRYSPLASGLTERPYGSEGMRSNYQGQGLALAKQFKPWPT